MQVKRLAGRAQRPPYAVEASALGSRNVPSRGHRTRTGVNQERFSLETQACGVNARGPPRRVLPGTLTA